MKTSRLLSIIVCLFTLYSCGSLKEPVVIKHASLDGYRYAFITPTKELSSSSSGVYASQYGTYRSSVTKSVNPSDVISGILIKKGFIILPELKPDLADKTVVVNYGESGRRSLNLGYTIEITIQFVSYKTSELICTCTAEGQGSTEADDIREAIERALSGLFKTDK